MFVTGDGSANLKRSTKVTDMNDEAVQNSMLIFRNGMTMSREYVFVNGDSTILDFLHSIQTFQTGM